MSTIHSVFSSQVYFLSTDKCHWTIMPPINICPTIYSLDKPLLLPCVKLSIWLSAHYMIQSVMVHQHTANVLCLCSEPKSSHFGPAVVEKWLQEMANTLMHHMSAWIGWQPDLCPSMVLMASKLPVTRSIYQVGLKTFQHTHVPPRIGASGWLFLFPSFNKYELNSEIEWWGAYQAWQYSLPFCKNNENL